MDRNGSLPHSHRAAASDASATDCSKDQTVTPYHALLDAIDAHTTVLTPNRRLAATLHKLLQAKHAKDGLTCWQTPDILPAMSWINRLWQTYTSQSFDSLPHLLSSSQEQILWESILRQSKENPLLLQITETASTVHSAWSLLKQWQIKLDHPALSSSDDYASMKKWAETFNAICQQRHWIDSASIPDLLMVYVAQGKIILPKRIILAGFTDHSPQMTALLTACEQQGVHIVHYVPPEAAEHSVKRCQLNDREDEIIAIARWAKAIHDLQPAATIGCVIPTLDEVRDTAQQLFTEVFIPPGSDTPIERIPFNISAGKPISHYPVIQAALTLLTLVKPSIPIDTFNQILTTPFIGEAEQERVKRANLDSQLRKSNVITISLKQILNTCHPEHSEGSSSKDEILRCSQNDNILHKYCPQLAKRLSAYLDLLEACKPYQTHAEWVTFISTALEALGWPGERSINSEEYQAIQRWLSLLLEYRQFDQVSTPISISDAIDRLQQLASKSFYQPQTPDAPIQILGLLEAAALPFDYLWVSGMDDVSWPPAPKPNPFLPKQLQRERHMPHATAERELTFCTRVMSQFIQTSGSLIYSHAAKNEKVELQASPLIRSFPLLEGKNLALAPHISPWDQLHQLKTYEVLTDVEGPAIPDNAKSIGGVKIIQNQAVCPFKAFAEHRLHARDIETPEPGLRAKDRGNMIHQIMETLWGQLINQQALLSLSDDALREMIDAAILQALQSDSNSRAVFQHYTQLERRRLQKLIWQWMQLEKLRNHFTVAAQEQTADVKLDQLSFTCKIDRIDQLDDQRHVIIDYKTGKNNDYKRWFGDRPEEPQLPIYALSNEHVAAIAYAQINTAESELIGIGDAGIDIKGVKSIAEIKLADGKSWQDQINDWKTILSRLANDFVSGRAVVDPKDPVKSCEYCGLKPLCRINEENPHAA